MKDFFTNIRIVDIVDVFLVVTLLYQAYRLIKGTAAINIFFGLLTLVAMYFLVDYFDMHLLKAILNKFMSVGVILLVVVFQPEIRRFLLVIGNSWMSDRMKILRSFIPKKFQYSNVYNINVNAIDAAIQDLHSNKEGALIVLLKNSELKNYFRTGVQVDARVSSPMIGSIFFKNSPLHDGAVIIQGNMIKAARCVLPVTEKSDFPTNLGLRHRAAVGISEISDAVSIVVSEQTGNISIAYKGILEENIPPTKFLERLKNYLKAED